MARTRLVGSRVPDGLMVLVRDVMGVQPGETEANLIRRALAKAAGVDPDDYPARPPGRPSRRGLAA